METNSESSSATKKERVQFAEAKRHGKFLRMHLRDLKDTATESTMVSVIPTPSVGSKLQSHSIEGRSSERKENEKLSHLLRQVGQKNIEAQFPPFEINQRTMQFVDSEMEIRYWNSIIHISSLIISAFGAIVGGFGIIYSWIQTLNKNSKGMSLYIGLSTFCSIFSIVFFRFFQLSSKPSWKSTIYKYYIFCHGMMFFGLVAIFSLTLVFYTKNRTLGEIEFMIMAFVVALPGDFRIQRKVTLFGNMFPFILLMVPTPEVFLFYRCVVTLILCSFVNLLLLRDLEQQRRRSFYSQENMKFVKTQVMASKQKTKLLLSNLYPVPVISRILQSANENPIFDSESCVIFNIQIITKKYEGKTDRTINEVEQHLGFGAHKICSTGLIIQCATGLFGESACNPFELANNIIQKCRITSNRYTGVRIGIGCGYAKGSVIEYSQKGFSVVGQGVMEANQLIESANMWEICLSESVKKKLHHQAAYKKETAVRLQNRYIAERIEDIEENDVEKESEYIDNGDEQRGRIPSLDLANFEEERNQADEPVIDINHEEIDPFLKARKERGFGAFIGDFRFVDQAIELEFQESLMSKDHKQAVTILLCAITLGAVLYGLVDLSLLRANSVDLGFSNIHVIYFRYFILVPIMVFGCLFAYFSMDDSRPNTGKYLRYTPYWMGSIYGYYVMVKNILVLSNPNFTVKNEVEQNIYFYVEVFESGFLFISAVWTIPFHAFFQIILWTLFTTSTFFYYANNIKLYGNLSYLWSFNVICVPMSVFWMMISFRDYYYRKQFLSKRSLTNIIKELDEERENMDIILRSTVSQELYDNINAENHQTIQVMENSFLVNVQNTILSSEQIRAKDNLFDVLSELAVIIENECNKLGLRLLRTSADGFIMAKSVKPQYDSNGFKYNDRLRNFIQTLFHIQNVCQGLLVKKLECQVETTVCVDQGAVFFGVVGTTHFSLDCFGLPVQNTCTMGQLGKKGTIMVSQMVADSFKGLKLIETIHAGTITTKFGYGMNLYEVREISDVWSMFTSHIDWMEHSDIIDCDNYTIVAEL